jgi:type I site-specific restriction endonuclease
VEVEHQSGKYVDWLPEWIKPRVYPLPCIYESTGTETRFTNGYDPDARSRRVFTFHRPDTLADWARQIGANADVPTFRARLRILFLVDRSNLGKQTKLEFATFTIADTQRKFDAEYIVQHLTSNTVDTTARVCIATVQRIYSILKGEPERDPELDEYSIYELLVSEPAPVDYNPLLPPEAFDVVIVDECHRSICGLWRQVLKCFDAHLIGLTATPTKQTFGFFRQNLVMEYSHDMAVADGVNVDFTVYKIETAITKQGSVMDAGDWAGFRNRLTRQVRGDRGRARGLHANPARSRCRRRGSDPHRDLHVQGRRAVRHAPDR